MNSISLSASLAALALVANSASADDLSTNGSHQAIGLFRLACLDHAGNAAGLRAFLDSHGLPRFSPQASKPFLQSGKGVVYDATAKGTRLAVSSEDDGACTIFADHANATDLARDLEGLWQRLATPYYLARDHDDPNQPSLHHRVYHLKAGGRIYSAVITTDAVPDHIQAFMTLSIRAPSDGVQQDDALNR